jgi:DNA repair protein RadD
MIEGFQLRPYQSVALDKIFSDLQIKQNVLLSGMMGCGKTAMSVRLIQRLYNEAPDMRFLVLMHKQELCQQFFDSFQKFTGLPFTEIGLCCAGLGEKILDRRVTIATIQTFVNVKEKYMGAGLIIVDEAHRIDINGETQYKQAFDYLRLQRPNSRLLGITATPARLGHGYIYGSKCKPGNVNLFDEISHKITYQELRDAGFLVPLKGVVANHESLSADLAGVSTNGDYVLDQLGEIMSREIHLHTAVEAIDKYCTGYKRVCVFCCTIDHAEKLHELLGDRSTIVHSRLSSLERSANMIAWERGDKPIMTSVNILTEGFDMPKLDCLVFARPTLSSSLFLQAVGRVLRTHPGKDHGFLVDLTDNTSRFGTDLDRIKVTVPKAVQAMEAKERTMWKICPNCEVEVHVALRECPDCGFEWPENECVVAAALPLMKNVEFQSSAITVVEPKWYDVDDFELSVHESRKNKKLLGRIHFFFSLTEYKQDQISMFLCFSDFYSGYAVQASQKKWKQISDDPFPVSVDDFFEREIYIPTRILVDINGKYPDLKQVEVDKSKSTYAMPEFEDEEIPF